MNPTPFERCLRLPVAYELAPLAFCFLTWTTTTYILALSSAFYERDSVTMPCTANAANATTTFDTPANRMRVYASIARVCLPFIITVGIAIPLYMNQQGSVRAAYVRIRLVVFPFLVISSLAYPAFALIWSLKVSTEPDSLDRFTASLVMIMSAGILITNVPFFIWSVPLFYTFEEWKERMKSDEEQSPCV